MKDEDILMNKLESQREVFPIASITSPNVPEGHFREIWMVRGHFIQLTAPDSRFINIDDTATEKHRDRFLFIYPLIHLEDLEQKELTGEEVVALADRGMLSFKFNRYFGTIYGANHGQTVKYFDQILYNYREDEILHVLEPYASSGAVPSEFFRQLQKKNDKMNRTVIVFAAISALLLVWMLIGDRFLR